jgi:hypothetical protein
MLGWPPLRLPFGTFYASTRPIHRIALRPGEQHYCGAFFYRHIEIDHLRDLFAFRKTPQSVQGNARGPVRSYRAGSA